ncbi:MAG: DUF2167 domain-containing protein [Parvularculaceae bacterium]
MTIRYYIGIISVFAVIFTGQACYARQDPASAADEYQYSPVAFTQALELTRGVVAPAREGGLYFNHDDACHLAVANWGWEKASCDSVDKMLFSITGAMDTVIIEQPNSDGYITFDDWRKKDLNKQIDTIWNELQSGLKSQSENLGVTITAEDWFIYPTLNAEKQYLYYATKLNWDGGDD